MYFVRIVANAVDASVFFLFVLAIFALLLK